MQNIFEPINEILPKGWKFISSLSCLSHLQKENLFFNPQNPFLSFEFLRALEVNHCVDCGEVTSKSTGWLPMYLLYENGGKTGLLLGYLKYHSYGEYVFDMAWADAYRRSGLDYYPKYVVAVPFTPVPCKKWLGNSPLKELDALEMMADVMTKTEITGIHSLFGATNLATPHNYIERHGCQFLWENEASTGLAYKTFTEFLGELTARKRKMILKERNKVIQAGIKCSWRSGEQISDSEMSQFYQYYQNTYLKRGRQGYLTLNFFKDLFKLIPAQVRLLVCYDNQKLVATALYFVDRNGLYGRYWGSDNTYDMLHFEACYYQGIEYCINNNIPIFNPGTQGEHKIPRGFRPTRTTSLHKVEHPAFQEPIRDFCIRETNYNEEYMAACAQKLPFKVLEC